MLCCCCLCQGCLATRSRCACCNWCKPPVATTSTHLLPLTTARAPAPGVTGADIMPLVRDALDSLEFISGPADSPWGSLRAAMGHPEPWSIRFMAIGNEVRAQQSTAQHNNAAQHSTAELMDGAG